MAGPGPAGRSTAVPPACCAGLARPSAAVPFLRYESVSQHRSPAVVLEQRAQPSAAVLERPEAAGAAKNARARPQLLRDGRGSSAAERWAGARVAALAGVSGSGISLGCYTAAMAAGAV